MKIPPALVTIRTTSVHKSDHMTSIKIVTWIILALTVIIVLARQSVKALLLRRPAVDDFLILVSTVRNVATPYDICSQLQAFVIGISIITTLLASQGLGDDSLRIEQIHFLMKGYYVSSFMYIAAIGSVKLSVLVIFYNILAIQRWARRIVIATGVFVLAWSVASILAIAFQCKMPQPWKMDHSRCSNMVGNLDIQ